MTDLTERTRNQLLVMFDRSDVDVAERIIRDRCGDNLPGLASADPSLLERIQLAAIRFSAGRLGTLNSAVDLAARDWRDLLVAARFADDPTAHLQWQPRLFNPDLSNHWFAGGSVPGVHYSLNQPVLVTIGPSTTQPGSVISLEGLEPEPHYLVELSSGRDMTVYQRNLATAD